MELKTPCIIINRQRLASKVDEFHNIGTIYYPVKANAFPEILKTLYNMGASFNVSATYYLDKLLELNVDTSRILWDNCFSSKNQLDYAINKQVTLFTVDSEEMLNYIETKCPNAKFLIKISNNKIGGNNYRFGSEHPEKLITLMKKEQLSGISFHLGRSLFNASNFKKMVEFVRNLGKFKMLNIGGGYDNLFENDEIVDYLLYQKKEGWFENLVFEPGRSLLNPVCNMFSQVIAVKEHYSQKWAKLDASIYSGLMDTYIEQKTYVICDSSKEKTLYYVSGYTSDSADFLGLHQLSANLKPGDIVKICGCGAYSFDMSCNYSGAKKLDIRME